jgi:Uma2 family endonuclease
VATSEISKPMTIEEFVEFSDRQENESKWLELVRGHLVERPWPTRVQGFVSSRIASFLAGHAEAIGRTYATSGACVQLRRDPDSLLRPDVAVFDDASHLAELHPAFGENPPLLAVMVVCLHVPFGRLIRLTQEYLAAGTRLVWVVDCEMRSVIVYPRGQCPDVVEGNDEITGEDVLPGFRCVVSEFFRLAGDKLASS